MTGGTDSDAAIARIARAGSERQNVLWIGGEVPLAFRFPCELNKYSVVPIATDVAELRRAAPTARALVIELGGATVGAGVDWAVPFVASARQHGLLVAVAHAKTMSPQAYYDAAAALDDGMRVLPPVIARGSEWADVARECAAHAPGPGEHAALDIQGELPPSDELRLLLCRAFYDMDAVHVDPVVPGKSGADVLVVSVLGEKARDWPHPFLVKVNGIAKVREERQKFADRVRRLIPRRCRPDVHDPRCVQGERLALLVQDFEGDVELLRDVMRRGGNAGVYVPALFSTALRASHASGRRVIQPLGRAFQDLKALRWESTALVRAASVARAHAPDVPDVPELRACIDGLPSVQYREGYVHGDLNDGNVFARDASTDVVVFDFANAMQGPVVADAACLEVSLAFRARDLAGEAAGRVQPPRALDVEWLRTAYTYPLESAQLDEMPRLPGAAGRDRAALGDALRAIRSAVRERDDSRPVYAVAVASYLLRYAAFDDHADDGERALAYEIASSLIRRADGAIRDASAATDALVAAGR